MNPHSGSFPGSVNLGTFNDLIWEIRESGKFSPTGDKSTIPAEILFELTTKSAAKMGSS